VVCCGGYRRHHGLAGSKVTTTRIVCSNTGFSAACACTAFFWVIINIICAFRPLLGGEEVEIQVPLQEIALQHFLLVQVISTYTL